MIVEGDLSEYETLKSSNIKTYLIKLDDFVRKYESAKKIGSRIPTPTKK